MKTQLSQSVSVTQTEQVPQKLADLLQKTVWGTPGKTRYRHLQTGEKLKMLRNPFFFMLERLEKLLMSVCLVWRNIPLGEINIDSYYIRYFVAAENIAGTGKRNTEVRKKAPQGIIKQFMEQIFVTGSAIKWPDRAERKSLFYAYVENENEQSMQMCEHYNFTPVRSMQTLPFSRFNPKKSGIVRKAKPNEYDTIHSAVKKQYSAYNFQNFEHLFVSGNYYVAEQDGRIVAGLQANPVRWTIENLPGLSGKMLIRLLPNIPFLKNIINPKQFNFSAIEGLFCLDGYEYTVEKLIESAMADQNHNIAMMWFDTECPVQETVKRHCTLGLLNQINDSGQAEIIVRGAGLNKADWLQLEEYPAYISCFDLT